MKKVVIAIDRVKKVEERPNDLGLDLTCEIVDPLSGERSELAIQITPEGNARIRNALILGVPYDE